MNDITHPSKIAFVADYLPRKCGIATFTHDLHHAVAAQYPEAECGVLAINDVPEGYHYASEVRFTIQEQSLRDYQEAADCRVSRSRLCRSQKHNRACRR